MGINSSDDLTCEDSDGASYNYRVVGVLMQGRIRDAPNTRFLLSSSVSGFSIFFFFTNHLRRRNYFGSSMQNGVVIREGWVNGGRSSCLITRVLYGLRANKRGVAPCLIFMVCFGNSAVLVTNPIAYCHDNCSVICGGSHHNFCFIARNLMRIATGIRLAPNLFIRDRFTSNSLPVLQRSDFVSHLP